MSSQRTAEYLINYALRNPEETSNDNFWSKKLLDFNQAEYNLLVHDLLRLMRYPLYELIRYLKPQNLINEGWILHRLYHRSKDDFERGTLRSLSKRYDTRPKLKNSVPLPLESSSLRPQILPKKTSPEELKRVIQREIRNGNDRILAYELGSVGHWEGIKYLLSQKDQLGSVVESLIQNNNQDLFVRVMEGAQNYGWISPVEDREEKRRLVSDWAQLFALALAAKVTFFLKHLETLHPLLSMEDLLTIWHFYSPSFASKEVVSELATRLGLEVLKPPLNGWRVLTNQEIVSLFPGKPVPTVLELIESLLPLFKEEGFDYRHFQMVNVHRAVNSGSSVNNILRWVLQDISASDREERDRHRASILESLKRLDTN